MAPVVIPVEELSASPAAALCWAELMAAQFESGEVHIVSLDPMADLLRINALRKLFQRAGAAVPPMPDPTDDPIANLLAWRDFLRSQTTVH